MKHRYRSRRFRRPRYNKADNSTSDGRVWWCHPTKGWRTTSVNNKLFK